MKRIVLNVDAALAEALLRKRAESGVPTNEFIRRAVRLALYADAAPKVEKRAVQPALGEAQ